ncbi:MAG TPA: aconitate hydratase [Actinomycetota bacterium]|nr:aconitate hydratase [Actinomycetota bacterium]
MSPSTPSSADSFGARSTLDLGGGRQVDVFRLDALSDRFDVTALPYSMKVLLENLLRNEDGMSVSAEDVEAVAGWRGSLDRPVEIAFSPARILMQDFTGVPAVVDLAAMRDAMADLGGDPSRVNPLVPVDLIIDHSIVADVYGRPDAFRVNAELEFERNRERYQLLRWAQGAFANMSVVPPNTGICHQVNLEFIAKVVQERDGVAFPDTLVGTDSHTPMVNGLGVVGWGVGGIEAEAAALGQPISMLIPDVVGFKLTGELPEGSTATDLVLTVTHLLRQHGVVGKFVEFYGPGVGRVPVENRATIGNMSPEYGSTITIFPIDDETLRYLRMTGRPDDLIQRVERYAKEQGLWHDPEREPVFSETLELDLSEVVPSLAGPKRPQDQVKLTEAKQVYRAVIAEYLEQAGLGGADRDRQPVPDGEPDLASALSFPASDPPAISGGEGDEEADAPVPEPPATEPERQGVPVRLEDGTEFVLDHGHVVIAAITSCTNTSNPSVMLGAALLARNAVEKGLTTKPWVKTNMAPGSQVVTDYYEKAGLWPYLEKLGYYLGGYGCTTCIGNTGPLPDEISKAINDNDLTVTAVLSGNRNFEGRISPDVKMNYLASPPLVIAYGLAGTMDFDFETDPLGQDQNGDDVFLKDIWPSAQEIDDTIKSAISQDMFRKSYSTIFAGDERWQNLSTPEGDTFEWDENSTYVRKAPYFDGMQMEPAPVTDISGARVLALLGDSVTTDHISPAGPIKPGTPAAQYLDSHGVARKDYNSLGSRRGNHEVMIRGTFANIRLQNRVLDGIGLEGTQGGYTRDFTQEGGPQSFIYDASQNYQAAGTPLVVLGGKEYGSGSSRDWAAKGTSLLGVKAVIVESFERIHRSNLIGMGVVPLQFPAGESWKSLGLDGTETFDIAGITELNNGKTPKTVHVTATKVDGTKVEFDAVVRIDTPGEADYYRNGGILQYVLRNMLRSGS